jgi:hypothetical protein
MSIEMNCIGATVVSTARSVDSTDDNDVFEIVTDRGTIRMHHGQECCESVRISDITGDPADLVGGVIALFEERTEDEPLGEDDLSRWTFYELRTTKGDITIRWFGSSNGYYGVSVDVDWLPASPA